MSELSGTLETFDFSFPDSRDQFDAVLQVPDAETPYDVLNSILDDPDVVLFQEPLVTSETSSLDLSIATLQPPTVLPMLCRSPSTAILSPIESLLWNYYVNFFSRSYPTCSDANNPFLSCLIPVAFQYTPVRQAMLALAALQAKNTYHQSINQEMHRLRCGAIEACRKISERVSGSDRPSPHHEDRQALTHFGFPGAMLLLSTEEKLTLVTTAILLILFAKLSGASYESARAHMPFAREYFVFEETFGLHQDSVTQTRLYVFLRNLLNYNELLASLAVSKAPTKTARIVPLEDEPRLDPSETPKQEFLDLLSRTSARVEDVSVAEFEQWDGNLDFIPSYATSSSQELSALPETANTAHQLDEESIAVREIYRTAGQIYYFRQPRDHTSSQQHHTAPTPSPRRSSPAAARAQITILCTRAITLLRTLPANTRYNTALLFPLGMIAPELRSLSHRAFVLEKLDNLHQRLHFDHYNVFGRDLIQAWAKADAQDGCQGSGPAVSGWRLGLPPRLVG